METLTKVRNFLAEDATIIPGQGRPMRPAKIDFPIRYLRELDTAVSAAIEAGGSVEGALEAASITHYGEHSQFDWAHNSTNLPDAYQAIHRLPSRELESLG